MAARPPTNRRPAARRFKAGWLARSVLKFRDLLVPGLEGEQRRTYRSLSSRSLSSPELRAQVEAEDLFARKLAALCRIEEEALYLGECAAAIRANLLR